MEQLNMMQNGMPGQQQQHNAAMQRPQPGNVHQQIFARIVSDVKNNIGQFAGAWQATLDPRTRANLIVQLVTALRMLERDVGKCINIAQRFEQQAITNAANRQHYEQSMQAKLEEIKQKREQNTMQMMQNGSMPNGVQQQVPMNMNGQPHNIMHPGNVNATGQPGFPGHLQRPMQPSLLQPQSQLPTTMDPSFLMAQPQVSQQFPIGMNTSAMEMQQETNQANASALQAEIQATAQQLLANMSDEEKGEIRKRAFASMTEEQRQACAARQGDPLKNWIIQRARHEVMTRRGLSIQGLPVQQQPNNARHGQNTQNLNMGNLNLNHQTGPQSAGNFSPSQLYGQQANALKMQELGETVVPVSANVNMNNMPNNVGPANGLNMLGNGLNQPSQLGNAADTQRHTTMLMQQQKQANKKQLQDQVNRNNLARTRALDQQRQASGQGHPLSGQLGGLNTPNNFNNGAMTSPAMPMLNRPLLATSEQASFGLNGQPNFSFPGADVAQHHQNIINQGSVMPNQPGQGGPLTNQLVGAMLNSLEPSLRNKILAMPPKEKLETINKLRVMHEQRQNQVRQQGMPGGQDPAQGQNGLIGRYPGAQQAQGLGMNQQQQQQQQHQQQQQQQQQHQQQQHQQPKQQPQPQPQDMQRMAQQTYIKGQAMLSRLLPQNIGSQLGIQIPPQVQRWAQLRAHIQQNQGNMPPHMHQRMMSTMERHFAQNPAELQQGIQEIIAHQRRQLAARNGQAPGMPNNMPTNLSTGQFMGQANVMQMSAPVAQMQPAVQNQLTDLRISSGMAQITAQDIAQLRAQRGINMNVTDEQIRNVLIRSRLAQMQANQVAAGQSNGQASQIDMLTNNMPPNNRQTVVNRAPMPNVSQPSATPKQPPQGGKRSAPVNDDVIEIPNPNAAAASKKATPLTNFQKMTPQQLASINPEQLAKLPKEVQNQIQKKLYSMQKHTQASAPALNSQQPAQMKPSMSSQGPGESNGGQQAAIEHRALVQRLYHEIGPIAAKGGPVKVDVAQANELRILFRKMWKPLQVLDKTLPTAYRDVPGFNDDQAKSLLRARAALMQNIADEEGNIRGYLSASASALRQLGDQIMRYYGELQKFHAKKPGAQGEFQNSQVPPSRGLAPPLQPTAPAMPGNNKSQHSHGRKGSTATKAPTAPVDDKKFWSGISSPHGVPKYDNQKPDLTADQLKMPISKKRKTGTSTSQPTTPANASTPSATPKMPSGKVGGPELARAAPKVLEPEQQRYRCPQVDMCDASITGLQSEAQLKAHIESAHAVIEDPYKFLMESATDLIREDSAIGNKHIAVKSKAQSSAMVKTASKQSNKAVSTQVKAPVKEVPEQMTDKSMESVLMEKLGFSSITEPMVPLPTTNNSSHEDTILSDVADILNNIDGHDTFNFDALLLASDESLQADAQEGSPPELTPGGAKSDTSLNSDISLNDRLRINLSWDPFGTGNTHIPDFLDVNDNSTSSYDFGMTAKQDSKAPECDKVAGKDKAGTDTRRTSADAWDWSKDEVNWEDLLNGKDSTSDASIWDDPQAL